MNYSLANPWAVFRIEGTSNILVTRFRKRSDADEYVKLLKHNTPFDFEVVFDA